MKFVDFTAAIAESSSVDTNVARRVIKKLYEHADAQLDAGEALVLPQFGRIVVLKNEDGSSRYVLHRATKTEEA